MSATEVRAGLFALLDDIERGEEVEITRFGKTVATLAPAVKRHSTLKWLFSGLAFSVQRTKNYSAPEWLGLLTDRPG